MKILILEDNQYLPESKDVPVTGRRYVLEPADDATLRQNSAFHALVMEYWRWGGHPKYGGDGYVIFRDKIKRDLGAGFESWVYADIIDGQPRIYKVDSFDDIPERIRTDKYKAEIIRGKLKSWSDYTKRERQKTIDNLLDDIRANGCNTAKMEEIIRGMMEDK